MLCNMISGSITTLSSIGIIGGSDGPTAIFVTSSYESILFPVVLALGIIVILYLLHKRK